MTEKATKQLRNLLQAKEFLHMPSVYDPFGGRLLQTLGYKAGFVGGYVTGAARAVTEPLLTLTEQVQVARDVAEAVSIPILADAGAGFGDALHTMRTVREFIRGGIAGIHIEDQLYPKRAAYHRYVAHAITIEEYVEKIEYACKERDRADPDFVVIARTDTCRFHGVEEATKRINAAAEVGADMGLLFPRNPEEAALAPKMASVPLIYVQSRGNRDKRPLFTRSQLQDMGYVACIEAQLVLCTAHHFMQQALIELRDTGAYTGISPDDFVKSRQAVEDLIGLDEYYEIEAATVETRTSAT